MRRCIHVQSRKHPDVQCKSNATYGDFCQNHKSGLRRFSKPLLEYVLEQTQAASRLQSWWRSLQLLTRRQGLAALEYDLATNKQELLSFDEISNIPRIYRWSYYDETGHCWLFDIRSLYHLQQRNPTFKNPYTQLLFHKSALQSMHNRLHWLTVRHYPLIHVKDPNDPIAAYTMAVVEVFVTIDALGYNTSADWFLSLNDNDHYEFRRTLSHIWNQLSKQQHKAILGRSTNLEIFDGPAPTTMLLRPGGRKWSSPNNSPGRRLQAQKDNLAAIKTLVTSAKGRGDRSTGALYALTALVHVSQEAAEAYPYLTDVFANEPRFEFHL